MQIKKLLFIALLLPAAFFSCKKDDKNEIKIKLRKALHFPQGVDLVCVCVCVLYDLK